MCENLPALYLNLLIKYLLYVLKIQHHDCKFCRNKLILNIFAIGCVKVIHCNIIKKFSNIFFTFAKIVLKNKKYII